MFCLFVSGSFFGGGGVEITYSCFLLLLPVEGSMRPNRRAQSRHSSWVSFIPWIAFTNLGNSSSATFCWCTQMCFLFFAKPRLCYFLTWGSQTWGFACVRKGFLQNMDSVTSWLGGPKFEVLLVYAKFFAKNGFCYFLTWGSKFWGFACVCNVFCKTWTLLLLDLGVPNLRCCLRTQCFLCKKESLLHLHWRVQDLRFCLCTQGFLQNNGFCYFLTWGSQTWGFAWVRKVFCKKWMLLFLDLGAQNLRVCLCKQGFSKKTDSVASWLGSPKFEVLLVYVNVFCKTWILLQSSLGVQNLRFCLCKQFFCLQKTLRTQAKP